MKPTAEQWKKAKLHVTQSGGAYYFNNEALCPLCGAVVKIVRMELEPHECPEPERTLAEVVESVPFDPALARLLEQRKSPPRG